MSTIKITFEINKEDFLEVLNGIASSEGGQTLRPNLKGADLNRIVSEDIHNYITSDLETWIEEGYNSDVYQDLCCYIEEDED